MIIRNLLALLIFLLSLAACENRAQNSAAKPEIGSIGENIDRYLRAMEAIGFSGAIVVEHEGEVMLSRGYGFANREKRIPFTPQTVQSNGSNTKQFTGAAILLLESRGELSVKDSLPRYFENVPGDKQHITLHQLLTHSSGLLQGVGYDEEPIEFAPFFQRLMAAPLEFEPGTGYHYSNAGYSLLAKIIEHISGVNYETFIREQLLKPSGILKTGYVLPEWDRGNMAIGYKKGERWGEVYKNGWIGDGPGWHLRGNGGLHTTAADMHRWLATVKGNGIPDKNAVEKWTHGYVTENNGYSKYGYGLVNYDHPEWGKVITHSGSNGIFTSEFFWLPEKEFFFYIHGNNSVFPAYKFEENILDAAFDTSFSFPPIIETSDRSDAAKTTQKEGTYHSDNGSIELMADDSRLIAKLYGQETLDLVFGHSDEQKEKLSHISAMTREIMKKLEQGDENAFKDIMEKPEDAKKTARSFLNRIIRMERALEALHVIGSFENSPGSSFYEYGRYTTFVHARFENWNQYWNIVWNADGTYSGTYSGPWPELTLIPAGNNQYKGMRATLPWNTVEVEFQGDCLMIDKVRFCLSGNGVE